MTTHVVDQISTQTEAFPRHLFPPKLLRILVKQKNTLQTEKKPPLAVYMMLLKIICIWINITQIYLSDIKRGTLFKITTELLKTRTFVLQPTEK